MLITGTLHVNWVEDASEPMTVIAAVDDWNEHINAAEVVRKLLPVTTTGIPGRMILIPVGNDMDKNCGVASMVSVSVDGKLVATVWVPLTKVKMMTPAA